MVEVSKRLSDSEGLATGPVSVERRRDERRQVGLRTISLLSNGVELRFHMRNISARGAMGQSEAIVRPGEMVRLTFEDGTAAPATVRWTRGTRIGVQFVTPIAARLFEAPAR